MTIDKRYITIFLTVLNIAISSSQIPRYIELNPWGLDNQYGKVSVDFADFNGDGNLDIVWATNEHPYLKLRIKYMQNNDLSTLGQVVSSPDKIFTYTNYKNDANIATGDLDSDGDIDIIICESGGFSPNAITNVLINNGSPTNPAFSQTSGILEDQFVLGVPSLIDINQDTLPDVVISNIQGKIQWYQNNGNLNFTKISTPSGLTSFKSPVSFGMTDINNDEKTDLISFSLESGFKKHIGQNYQLDSTVVKTFIDPGLGTNYFYEIRFKDCDQNANDDLFLTTFSSTENSGYVTRFYLIKDIQECPKILYLTDIDNPLSGTYRASSQIILIDSMYIQNNLELKLSAAKINIKNYLNASNPVMVDTIGCKQRGM